ncbi:GTPase EngB [Arthroderma uncinatum]|uniref:GTPase EngB n=1 Tax=Arthroderma uncinatum TaxID=74035 RepID=UPI00144A8D0A|nr:GTPase EngB [Arthroderma uncinatum]KAF3490536.1 GTPase EngB [Arthroderma uncinatum]
MFAMFNIVMLGMLAQILPLADGVDSVNPRIRHVHSPYVVRQHFQTPVKPYTPRATQRKHQVPGPEQLEYATHFFAKSRHSPIHLWTTNLFRKIPESDTPEVVFMGRSNVGKSSVINMLVGDNICFTSATPGRTQTMNAFAVGGRKGGESKINIIDSPGYGKASRPEWGHELMKYLSKRKQLRRVFLIIESKAGVKTSDKEVLSILREFTVPHQIIVSKADGFLTAGRTDHKGYSSSKIKRFRDVVRQIRKEVTPITRDDGIPPLGDILACSTKIRVGEGHHKIPLGIDALQWAIIQAAGLDHLPSQASISLPKQSLEAEGDKGGEGSAGGVKG